MDKHETRLLAIKLADEAQAMAKAGEYEGAAAYAAVSQAYAAIARTWGAPEQRTQEETAARVTLPEWCGECDGPPLSQRWITVQRPDEPRPRAAKCPRCNPNSETYLTTPDATS